MDEIKEQLGGQIPESIVCSVGGGGLFNGIMRGLEKNGWNDKVKVVTVETYGAESLFEAIKQKKLITLDGIKSVAKTLGATQVSKKAFENAQKENVECTVLLDKEAVEACEQYFGEYGIWVEPSCGASLALLKKKNFGGEKNGIIVVIVCGGNAANKELMEYYKHNCYCPDSE